MASTPTEAPTGLVNRMLGSVERIGNKLPDPAMLFLIGLFVVWALSALLAPVQFADIDPRSGEPIRVVNLLTGSSLAFFLSNMVSIFTSFAPLGVVLVAMLGVGVADEAGYFNTSIKLLLSVTSRRLLAPAIILVGLISHSAVDAGYVLVIPLGGIIFYAAGRHPLAGIAAAFAGVSGGFSANPVPSALDPLLQGFTQPRGPDRQPRHPGQPAEQLLLHGDLQRSHHRPGVVHHRCGDRAPAQRLRTRR